MTVKAVKSFAHYDRDSLERLSVDDQCHLLDGIGELACARAARQEEGDAELGCSPTQCANQRHAHNLCSLEDLINAMIEILPHLQKLVHCRVAAMKAVQRLLTHSQNTEHLNMRTSVLGQWCLQAVHSSLRDLRISAGYLTCYQSGITLY